MKKIITAILAGALLFNATNAAAYDWEETLLCGKATLSWNNSINVSSHIIMEAVPLAAFSARNCTENLMGYLYTVMGVYPHVISDDAIGLYADAEHKDLIMTISRRLSWTKKLGNTGRILAEVDRMKGGVTVQAVLTDKGECIWASAKGKEANRMMHEYIEWYRANKGE